MEEEEEGVAVCAEGSANNLQIDATQVFMLTCLFPITIHISY